MKVLGFQELIPSFPSFISYKNIFHKTLRKQFYLHLQYLILSSLNFQNSNEFDVDIILF